MGKYYTGIGSRSTPNVILLEMSNYAKDLASEGYILRSGGASGADQAFEFGADYRMEIFLPFSPFNGRRHNGEYYFVGSSFDTWYEALKIASNYHPNWDILTSPIRALMARNVYQVLGPDLNTPSKFVICWTPDGSTGKYTSRETGGTGQALRIAYDYEIPVENLNK